MGENIRFPIIVYGDAIDDPTGAFIVSGGSSLTKNLYVGGAINLLNTVDSTSPTTGNVILAGGMGVSKNLYAGDLFIGTEHVATEAYVTTALSNLDFLTVTEANATFLTITNASTTYQPIINSTHNITLNTLTSSSTTDSSSTTTGAIKTAGGLGVAKSIYAGGSMNVTGAINAGGSVNISDSIIISGTQDSSSLITGSFRLAGGGSVTKNFVVGSNLYVSGTISCYGTSEAVSSTAAAFTVAGGLGVAKNISVGGNMTADVNSNGNIFSVVDSTFTDNSTPATTTNASWCAANFGSHVLAATNTSIVTQVASTVRIAGPPTSGTNQTIQIAYALNVVNGNVKFGGTTNSTSPTTGSLSVMGGLGVVKDIYSSGVFYSTNTTDSTSALTGSMIVSGGVGIAKGLSIGSTTDSSSTTTGSFTTGGGMGVAKNLYAGNMFIGTDQVATQVYVTGLGYLTSASASSTYQPLITTSMNINLSRLTGASTTESTSTTTGAIVTAGGLGVGKNIYAANMFIGSDQVATQTYVTGLGYLTTASASSTYLTQASASSTYLTQSNASSTYLTQSNASSTYLTQSNAASNYQPLITSSSNITSGTISITNDSTFSAVLSMSGNKITNLATPTSGTDAANKAYVDASVQGLSTKQSVVAGTTTAGTLASSFANGSIIDGVTLATGNRILIKNQATASENGIYVVNASGAPTRASDFAAGTSASGSYVFVEQGTTNADAGFVVISDAPNDIVGTNNIDFTQFSGAGQTAAGTGLTKIGNTLSVNASQTQITSVGTLTGLTSSGVVSITDTTQSTSTTTGAITVAGGMAVAKNLYATNIFIGSDQVATQAFVTSQGYASGTFQPLIETSTDISLGALTGSSTTDSSSTTTGAFITAGGMGVAKNLYAGNMFIGTAQVATQSYVTGLGYLTSDSASSTYLTQSNASSTYLTIASASSTYQPIIGTSSNITLSTLIGSSTTDSTSTTTGAFKTAGGLGVAKNIYAGNMFIGTDQVATQAYVTGLGYLTISSASSTYLTTSSASSTYLTQSSASSTYLTQSDATATYLTQANAASTYLTISTASSTYQPIIGSSSNITLSTLSTSSTTDSTSISTGSVQIAGGIGIAKSMFIAGAINITNTTQSNSLTTGSVVISGGVGVAKNVQIEGCITLGVTNANFLAWSGGAQQIGYCSTAGNYFTNTAVGDLAFRNLGGSLRFGISSSGTSNFDITSTGNAKVNTTTDATSTTTGALQVSGGAAIAKSLYIGNNIQMTSGNCIVYTTGNLDAPTFTTRSVGTRYVIYPAITGSSVDHAMGVEVGYMWFSCASSINGFKWYSGTTNIAILQGTGEFDLLTTADSTSTSSGTLIVSGGIGIAKSMFVGGAINITNTTPSTSATTGSLIVSGGIGVSKTVTIGSSLSAAPSSAYGNFLNVNGSTFTDNSTAASGNVVIWAASHFDQPTLAATNTGVTTTTASTVRIAGPPIAGTNQTFTYAYSLNVVSGNSKLGGNALVSGVLTIADTTDSTSYNTGCAVLSGGLAISKYVTLAGGFNSSGTIGTGGLSLEWSGSGGGYKHYIISRHAAAGGSGNAVDFFINSSASAGGSTAPGTGNIRPFVIDTTFVGVMLTTDSSSSTTGSLQISGGMGVAKSTFIGLNLNVAGTSTLTGNSTFVGTINQTNTTDSTTSTTGSIVVAGGVGIAKSLVVGNITYFVNDINFYTTKSSANPLINFDANAYFFYNRTTNTFIFTNNALNCFNISGTAVSVTVTADSSSSTTGSLMVSGGTGIAKNLYVGGNTVVTNLNVTTTTDSSSATTGSLIVSGGLGVAKSLYVGTNLNMSDGSFQLFTASGIAAPTFTTRSAGTRTVFYPGLSGSSVDFAIGIDTAAMWYSVDGTGSTHKWYCGTTNVMYSNFINTAILTTADSTSTTTGALQVSGGVGIAKALYIGGSNSTITLTGTTPNINFSNTNTGGPPTYTTRSTGTKIILYDRVDATNVDYGIGQDGRWIWMSAAKDNDSTYGFKWYGGTTNTMTLNNTGTLSIYGTTDSSSTSTGVLQIAGGMGIAKSTYIGGATYINASGLHNSSFGCLRIGPSANGSEASIGFYQNTSYGGSSWMVGHNAGGSGSGYFSIYSSALATTTLTVSPTGVTTLPITTDSTSSTTGALQIAGGVSIAKSLYIGSNILYSTNAGAPTFTTRSAGTKIILYPSIGASSGDHAIGVEGSYNWYSAPSTGQGHKFYSGTTNTLLLEGNGNLFVKGVTYFSNFDGNFYGSFSGANPYLQFNGSAYIIYDRTGNSYTFTTGVSNSFVIAQTYIYVNPTTDSTSATTGALQVAGGAGIAKTLSVGATTLTSDLSTGNTNLELGVNRTGDGNCFIDFHSSSGTDYDFRIIRFPGVNGAVGIYQTGTAGISISSAGGVAITATADSTSATTGALTIVGGLGVNKSLYVNAAFSTFTDRLKPATANGNLYINPDQNSTTSINWNNSSAVLIGDGTATCPLQILTTTNSTSTTTGALQVAGGASIVRNLYVGGALSKGSGTFNIPHPVPEKQELGYRLQHSFVESPTRGDNIYRYTCELSDKEAQIELPDYFPYLNEDVQVWVCPVKHFGKGYGYVVDNILYIVSDTDGTYNILLIGTRCDEIAKANFDPNGIEYIDENF